MSALGQEDPPGSIHLCMQPDLLLENIFRDSKLGAALQHLPSGYPQVNLAWLWGALLAASTAASVRATTNPRAPRSSIGAGDSSPRYSRNRVRATTPASPGPRAGAMRLARMCRQ